LTTCSDPLVLYILQHHEENIANSLNRLANFTLPGNAAEITLQPNAEIRSARDPRDCRKIRYISFP
jgi:hypothetical protein